MNQALRRVILGVETLEERAMPAVFGTPWLGDRVTVSFVPDGTPIGPAYQDASGVTQAPPSSQLFSTLSATMPQQQWQREVLRALQTWAAAADLNLVVVPDNGAPLGTPGAAQGDSRFGDIRIAATSMSLGSVSSSVPFTLQAGTWSGDLLFNTRYSFGVQPESGFDLYSVALHEAGHIFGVGGQATQPGSPMFEYYSGVQTGLSATEVAAIAELYGERQPDRHEGSRGNDTLQTAASLQEAAVATLLARLREEGEDANFGDSRLITVSGDLRNADDVDIFAYQAGRWNPGLTVRLRVSDVSLLTGKLTVLDEQGGEMASVMSLTPGGDLSLRIEARPNQRLFFRVEKGDTCAFGIGSYRLIVEPDQTPLWNSVAVALARVAASINNNSILTATTLRAEPDSAPSERYSRAGRISSAADADFYRLQLPESSSATRTMTVMLTGPTGVGLGVQLLDWRGQAVNTSVVPGPDGLMALRAEGLQSGKTYYLVVRGSAASDYMLSARLEAPLVTPEVAVAGTLTAQQPLTLRGVVLPQTGVMNLQFDASAPGAITETSVEFALFNFQGQMVYRQVVRAGQRASVNLLLPAGAYTIRVIAGTADGSPLPTLTFGVQGLLLSDPIGPQLLDPTEIPPHNIYPTWYDGGFLMVFGLLDPYGKPITFVEQPPLVFLPPEMIPLP